MWVKARQIHDRYGIPRARLLRLARRGLVLARKDGAHRQAPRLYHEPTVRKYVARNLTGE